jgi:hypothetical protein
VKGRCSLPAWCSSQPKIGHHSGRSRACSENCLRLSARRFGSGVDDDGATRRMSPVTGGRYATGDRPALPWRLRLLWARRPPRRTIMTMARRHVGFLAGDPDNYVSSIITDDTRRALVLARQRSWPLLRLLQKDTSRGQVGRCIGSTQSCASSPRVSNKPHASG